MARPLAVNLPHSLGKEEARRRVERGFGQLQQQLGGGLAAMLQFTNRWEGDRLIFEGGGLGQKINGRIDVLADSLQWRSSCPKCSPRWLIGYRAL